MIVSVRSISDAKSYNTSIDNAAGISSRTVVVSENREGEEDSSNVPWDSSSVTWGLTGTECGPLLKRLSNFGPRRCILLVSVGGGVGAPRVPISLKSFPKSIGPERFSLGASGLEAMSAML